MPECVRRAWLTLGGATMPLEDEDAGYYLTELDLGYPEVRSGSTVTDRPDADGVIDRTLFMGSRVVSANVVALASAGAVIDAVASAFAPYMVPAVRPVLHYVLDRPGATERTMVVRASGYTWPLKGAKTREIQLQWVAADPVARAVDVRTATAFAGSATMGGRTYPLGFNRVYGTGGMVPTPGVINSAGDAPVRPVFRIYGPATGPVLTVKRDTTTVEVFTFAPSFTVAANHFVDLDSDAHTVVDDTGASQYSQLNWAASNWAALLPHTDYVMTIAAGSASAITQAVAAWQDGYLT